MSATIQAAETDGAGPVALLIAALTAHRAGRIAAAEAAYAEVLAVHPGHPAALRLLGLLLLGSGRATDAVPILRDAAAAQPEDADAATALADAHAATGAVVEANVLYRRVLASWPTHHAARVNLANALRDAGDAAGAIAECRLALATAPRLLAAHMTLGSAMLAADRVAEAIGAYRTATTIAPNSASALCGLAMALLRDRRAVDALDAATRATAELPALAEAWFVRGIAAHALGHHEAARDSLARAIAADPNHARARLALGNVLADLDMPEEAEHEIRRSVACDPTLAEAHASLGFVLAALGRPRAAVAACDAAIALRSDFARAHWNRSVACLLGGDYASGWSGYEWRRRDPQFAAGFPVLDGELWRGEDLAGRTLLVWAEQGLGDAIQFARYLPLLAGRGARVVVACAPPLRRLLTGLPGVAATVAQDEAMPPYDRFVFQMSLPLMFGSRLDTIPAAGGYLAASSVVDPTTDGRPRIGLAWAGNPAHANDRRRSLPTACLAPLAALPGIAWTNLQQAGRGAELAIMHRLPAPAPDLSDLADTAACIAGLDLVISADTAVAHLAGALGKPVWIMLPHAPDWRWLLDRTDSPWYASARLFRQERAGDWDGVVARVAEALRVP